MSSTIFDEDVRPAVVLLIDDDPGDRELTRRALQQGAFRSDMRVACDGEEALDYLLHRGKYKDPQSAPVPDIILLDLNMPRLSGREVLERLKGTAELKSIPVIVLTTSHQEEDILHSYELGCNSYIQKPVELNRLVSSIQQLGFTGLS